MDDKIWEQILGIEIYEGIDTYECERLQERLWQKTDKRIYQIYKQTDTYYCGILPEMSFPNFYRFFIQVAWNFIIDFKNAVFQNQEELERIVVDNVCKGIAEIPGRCLIRDIHECKEKGLLSGRDEWEEYEDYEEHFLKSPDYIKELCKKYPEVLRLILLRINQVIMMLKDVLCAFNEDQMFFAEYCGSSEKAVAVKSIELGISDVHTTGKTVSKIELINGSRFMYKPHRLYKNQMYEEITKWFYQNLNLSYRKRSILAKEDYGWEEYIESEGCENKVELKNYFYRLGVQLFICYLTDASDIHCENLIANGEYPELIDLETIPGNISVHQGGLSENTLTNTFLRESVLRSGILPVALWGSDAGQGNINVIHAEKKCITPFKLPVITNPKSSSIQIMYAPKEFLLPDSLPVYQNKIVDAYEFTEEICEGFCAAYHIGKCQKEEVLKRVIPLYKEQSRHVFRHTQQYAMYLSLSLSPEFMRNTKNRIYLLHVLKARKEIQYEKMFSYELESMLNLEIPVYFHEGDGTELYAGDGTKCADVFQKSAFQNLNSKINRLSEVDLQRQLMLIRLSMEYNLDRKESTKSVSKRKHLLEDDKDTVLYNIVKQLEIFRLGDKGYMDWIYLTFRNGKFELESIGMNLYDGIPGVAVFYALLKQKSKAKNVSDVLQNLDRLMFSYTDDVIAGKKEKSCQTGMFAGEGSIVYGYLLLYQITGRTEYLYYAEKHVITVKMIAEDNTDFDLLSGNAGGIVVLAKLYQITNNFDYVRYAINIGEELWEKSVPMEQGRGWICTGQEVPLAGMAHGNSGFILAYAYLLQLTGDEKYVNHITQLLSYEDSLYSIEKCNWFDLRKREGKAGVRGMMNAWCHGAPGILLSRIKLLECSEFQENEQVRADISNGIRALMNWETEKNFCICHGLAGCYWIMKMCGEKLLREDLMREADRVKIFMTENIGNMPLKEWYNIGFMSGITGVGSVIMNLTGLSFLN